MESPFDAENLGLVSALWCQHTLKYARLPVSLPAPPPGGVVLTALASAVSRGTERLVLTGAVPREEWERMRCPHQEGEFSFPVKYGYALVGRVTAGPPELEGRLAFALHPHQTHAVLPAEAVTPIPENVPPRRATLAANMETALNVVWDAGIQPCDHVLVAGAGVVGLLIAHLAAKIPGTRVTVTDPDAGKAAAARALGAAFSAPDAAPEGVDVAINASATGEGLRTALAAAGREATVVEASWHGDHEIVLPLGGAFHSQRLRLVSSQVGALPPARAPRWTHARRLAAAIGLLEDAALDALISHEVPFSEAPDRLPALLTEPGPLAIVLTYEGPAD